MTVPFQPPDGSIDFESRAGDVRAFETPCLVAMEHLEARAIDFQVVTDEDDAEIWLVVGGLAEDFGVPSARNRSGCLRYFTSTATMLPLR